MLRGNWIRGRVAWGAATDDPDNGRRAVLTEWSGQAVQVRVAMRDAELFSLSVGCTQRPHYTRCHRAGASGCSTWGAHYAAMTRTAGPLPLGRAVDGAPPLGPN